MPAQSSAEARGEVTLGNITNVSGKTGDWVIVALLVGGALAALVIVAKATKKGGK
jgi:hypothetical protein